MVRVSVEAPVRWPSESDWRVRWTTALVELEEELEVDADGYVVLPEDPAGPAPDDPRIRLVAGHGLDVGARYVLAWPGVTMLSGAAGIGGVAGRRLVHLSLRNHHHHGSLRVDLDSLDTFTELRAVSDVDHAKGEVVVRPDASTPLVCDIRLDWLRLELAVEVSGPAGAQRLVASAGLRGRLQWRPVLAPLLAVGRPLLRRGLQELVDDAARSLGEIADDPATGPLDHAARRRRDVEHAAALMRQRATLVASQMAGRPWWQRRRPRRWLAVLAELPDPAWPPHEVLESWTRRERSLLREYARSHRRQDPTWVGDELVRQEEARNTASALTTDDSAGDAPVGGSEDPVSGSSATPPVGPTTPTPSSDPYRPLRDEDLDLRFLASPWTVYRKLAGDESVSDTAAAARVTQHLEELARSEP